AAQVRGASRRRPPHPATDPEMAQGWVMEEGKWSEAKTGSPQGSVITPLTQKVISSSKEQLWDGEKGAHCLISVVNSNIFTAHGALDQSEEGSPAECRSWPAAASRCASRSSASVGTRVRFIRAPSLSLPGRSLPSRSTSRSSRSHGAGYVEASAADGATAPEVCKKQP